jgi:hypothetical protein
VSEQTHLLEEFLHVRIDVAVAEVKLRSNALCLVRERHVGDD